MPDIAVIAGPTASGKTALGIALAKKTGGEIVSADSMQIYKHMDIGTAKPSIAEMDGVAHHMIDIVTPFEKYSVARYVSDASECVNSILARGKLPIIVGGTGLYIDSLISGRAFSDQGDESLRLELSERYDSHGGDALLSELRKADPVSAERLHPNDKKRIIRALEIFTLTGMTITEHNEMTQRLPPRYRACLITLSYMDREDLYQGINRRVDVMMEKGLLNEVKTLIDMGLTRTHTAMQAIGYKELTEVILGNKDIAAAVESIKLESRHYAKRQLSWFRRYQNAHWLLWEKEPDFDTGLQISTKYLEYFGYNKAVFN